MNTCSNCKYWYTREEAYSHRKITVCESQSDLMDIHAESLDDSGLDVALVTSPDFACNQWEISK